MAGLSGSGTAWAWSPGTHEAVLVEPHARARWVSRFVPAGGPLGRHAARPGAWYALLYLPIAPRWPMELALWSTAHRHEMQLFALDAAPDDAPGVVHPLPLETESLRNGPATVRVSRFMLPAASVASAIFVLVEQWRLAGDEPAPLWVQWRAQVATPRRTTPWWSAHGPRGTGITPPPSPLTQEQRGTKSHEVPIFGPPAWPEPGAYR